MSVASYTFTPAVGNVPSSRALLDEWTLRRRRVGSGQRLGGFECNHCSNKKALVLQSILIVNEPVDGHEKDAKLLRQAEVSRHIGETEKNLRHVFDAAEDGGAILLFDEADATFGKRSEVKDSHHQYANIESNYQTPTHGGLSRPGHPCHQRDERNGFRLRAALRLIVNFPFPGAAERKRMWEREFPAVTRTERLDHGPLARSNLTGGSIHNVVLNAAFLAAQTGNAVTMPLIFEAAHNEFRNTERPIRDVDFRWLESAGGSV